MQKKVAIFDVDGTIFSSSLLIELVNVLVDRKVFPEDAHLQYEKEYLAWLDRRGSYGDYILAVVDVFIKYIKGVKEEDLASAAKLVTTQQGKRTYRYTRGLISKLKEEGYYLLAISHSPKLVLEEFTKTHGFDKAYGLIYEIDKERKFTGRILDEELIFNKAKVLARALEKEGLTLDGSVGVGDTESDITFLSVVEKPICFNPNSALYEHGKKQGWKIVLERKDVIYEL